MFLLAVGVVLLVKRPWWSCKKRAEVVCEHMRL